MKKQGKYMIHIVNHKTYDWYKEENNRNDLKFKLTIKGLNLILCCMNILFVFISLLAKYFN